MCRAPSKHLHMGYLIQASEPRGVYVLLLSPCSDEDTQVAELESFA